MNSQLETVVFEMEKAVRGKRRVIEHILAALLAEGHILLDDMPGVGKTPRWPWRSPAPSICATAACSSRRT